MSKLNLSIYLIKENIVEFDDIVENATELHSYDNNSIAYYDPSFVREPDWLSEFFKLRNNDLRIANARVLFLKRLTLPDGATRIFAITFGYGKTLLKEDVFEEQFGLKIVLNSIDRNKIRKISKTDIGKNYKQSQEQMPRESDIGEFGFDVDRDLIKYVTGKSEDEHFGKAIISGGDIFNLVIEKDVDNIDDFLKYCYGKYKKETYKENFDWLDNIKLLRNKSTIERLNEMVVESLNNRDFSRVWLAIPEVINWEKVKCIYISGQQDRRAEYVDIDNDIFVDSFKNSTIQNIDQIKSKIISVKSTEGDEITKWSAMKCLVGSLELGGKAYAINNGNWYEINSDFATYINDAYNSIPLSNLSFIDCPRDKDEDWYNEELTKDNPCVHLIHKFKIPIGGGSGNNIEPCDVAIGKTLIHIKCNGGSTYLSHLFNQATNSCSALKDVAFRNKFKEKLNASNIYDVIDDEFDASNYTIVIGIINKYHDERPRIPFFSKVSIKYAFQQIKNLGYNFEIKTIKKL